MGILDNIREGFVAASVAEGGLGAQMSYDSERSRANQWEAYAHELERKVAELRQANNSNYANEGSYNLLSSALIAEGKACTHCSTQHKLSANREIRQKIMDIGWEKRQQIIADKATEEDFEKMRNKIKEAAAKGLVR